MKDELVNQLKTQITDLERFIKFLHGEGTWEGATCTCTCNKPAASSTVSLTNGSSSSIMARNGNTNVRCFVPSEFQHEEEVKYIKFAYRDTP